MQRGIRTKPRGQGDVRPRSEALASNKAVFAMNICGYSTNTAPGWAVIRGLNLCFAGTNPGFE